MTDDTLSISQTPPGANCIAPDTPPVGASGAHSSNIGRRRWGKPLTALQIQNAKATGKGYKLPDERGLYLFVTARAPSLGDSDITLKGKSSRRCRWDCIRR
jgi:hypothetical protein